MSNCLYGCVPGAPKDLCGQHGLAVQITALRHKLQIAEQENVRLERERDEARNDMAMVQEAVKAVQRESESRLRVLAEEIERRVPRPMGTAPRDGTEIMAYHIDGKNYHPVAYLEGYWKMRWNAEYCCGDRFYSGWIPYPEKASALPLEEK